MAARMGDAFASTATRSALRNIRRSIVLSDSAEVIQTWMKLYRFGRSALN